MTDPKAAMASQQGKIRFDLIPRVALEELAISLNYGANLAPRADGCTGYGEWNWRQGKGIELMQYHRAIMSHDAKFADGADRDPDTDEICHHLGAIMATCSIMLDAHRAGKLIDDRPKLPNSDTAKSVDLHNLTSITIPAGTLVHQEQETLTTGAISEIQDPRYACFGCGLLIPENAEIWLTEHSHRNVFCQDCCASNTRGQCESSHKKASPAKQVCHQCEKPSDDLSRMAEDDGTIRYFCSAICYAKSRK